jgi:asparagine synthase (glutamine-hydrolysing)
MCGINGFNWHDEAILKKMSLITKNRGPDDEGAYLDENVSLGHNRLSIIDLSEKGHQPMSNEDGTVWITYNGEVYNFQSLRDDLVKKGHVFKSGTDTEAIVHAYEEYGLDAVKKFNGMWAFCIYDKNKGLLILSRDQFGIKPLYYFADNSRIIFSSMISAIFCHDIKREANDRAILEYLAYNLEDHGEDTFFKNIHSLARDSILVYDLKGRSHRLIKWYEPTSQNVAMGDIDSEVKEKFIESVKLRTIADVPIGSCLSGGVDSSAIVCTLDRLIGDTFYTFSLIAPGSKVDESRYIKEIGRVTRTKQFFTELNETDFLEEFKDFVISQEEPVTGMSPYAQYRVMKLARQNGAKVLLDGQGGDEIFAGYVYYYGYYFYELLASLKFGKLFNEMASYGRNFKNLYPHGMLVFLLLPDMAKYALWKNLNSRWINYGFFERSMNLEKDIRWKRMGLQEALKLTLFTTAIPHLLRWEDKNSMRWSIETRPPFLDIGLVELAMSLPPEKKLKDGRTKVVFKDAIRDIIPDVIRERKDKIGFAAPVDDFIRKARVAEYCNGIISSEKFKGRDYWDHEEVLRIFTDHINKKINAGNILWKCINTEVWLEEFIDKNVAASN